MLPHPMTSAVRKPDGITDFRERQYKLNFDS